MENEKLEKISGLLSALRRSSVIGLTLTAVLLIVVIFVTGSLDSLREAQREARSFSTVGAISLESADSLQSINRLLKSIGANRNVIGVYLLRKSTMSIVTSNRPSHVDLLKPDLLPLISSASTKDFGLSELIRQGLSGYVLAMEEVLIEKFSSIEIPSGRYLIVTFYKVNIFSEYFFRNILLYALTLCMALLTLLWIQKRVLQRLYLNSFMAFVNILKNWDSTGEQRINELSGTGEIIDLKKAFIALYKDLESAQAQAALSAKMASLGEMSAGVAHEINNPLALISGNIQLLDKYRNDDLKFKAKLETMARAAFRIEKIVKGLKKFSRTAEKTERRIEDLKSIVEEALIIVDAKSKRCSIPVRVETETGLFIRCNAVEIEQVIINLLNNGIDAVKDSKSPWVIVKAEHKEGSIVLQVIDSGSGISDEVEKKLFQPFFTTKAVGEGTGLGLSISKGILEEHNATFRLNRNIKNTCFEVVFPKADVAAEEVKNVA